MNRDEMHQQAHTTLFTDHFIIATNSKTPALIISACFPRMFSAISKNIKSVSQE